MSNPNNNEKEFINGVWRKTKYFEYLKTEEEKSNLRTSLLRKRKIKSLLTFGLGLILLTTVTLLVAGNLRSHDSISLVGIYMMGFALYYEYNFN